MHPTAHLGGIKGIFPIIKRHAPNAISYPSRFSGIANTRIAIDATLLLQRLHFAPDPHPARHILGLLRLIRVLRSHSIKPIMVFDNPDPAGRLPQKEREREKRSRARALVKYRNEAERRRGVRLQHLEGLVKELRLCSAEERTQVARLLAGWGAMEEERPEETRWSSAEVEVWIDRALQEEEELDEADAMGIDVSYLPGDVIIDAEAGDPLDPPRISEAAIKLVERTAGDEWTSIIEAESGRIFSIALQLHQLRSSFRQSKMPQALDELLGPDTAARLSGEGDGAAVAQLGETAQQAQLTAMEGEAYDALASTTEDPIEALEELERRQEERYHATTTTVTAEEAVPQPVIDQDETPPALPLSQIVSRYATLSQSYARRVSPIPPTLFAQSAELCGLLGVPVLFTGGGGMEGGRPHEAEALCASLVRNGWADMVASEDSDTLLYGAKLLRNLVGTKKELELVEPDAMRRALFGGEAEGASDVGSGQELAKAEREAEDERTQKMLLDFALLCGTDFNRTIPGIASKRALDLIRRHGDISSILAAHSHRLQPPSGLSWKEFQRELQGAREVFANPPSLRWHTPELRRHGLEGQEMRERRIEELAARKERERWARRRRAGLMKGNELHGEETALSEGEDGASQETEGQRRASREAYAARLRRRQLEEDSGALLTKEDEQRERERARRLRDFLQRYAGEVGDAFDGAVEMGGEQEGEEGRSRATWEDVWEEEIGMALRGAESEGRAKDGFGKAPFDDAEVVEGQRRRESAVWTP